VVYLNASGAGGDYAKISEEIRTASGGAFESIWVIVFGTEAGTGGEDRYYLSCASQSALLARADGWLAVPLDESNGP
jgi:hypothetical protein